MPTTRVQHAADAAIRRPVKVDAPVEMPPGPSMTPVERELAVLKKRIASARIMPVPHGIADERTWTMGRDAAIAAILREDV